MAGDAGYRPSPSAPAESGERDVLVLGPEAASGVRRPVRLLVVIAVLAVLLGDSSDHRLPAPSTAPGAQLTTADPVAAGGPTPIPSPRTVPSILTNPATYIRADSRQHEALVEFLVTDSLASPVTVTSLVIAGPPVPLPLAVTALTLSGALRSVSAPAAAAIAEVTATRPVNGLVLPGRGTFAIAVLVRPLCAAAGPGASLGLRVNFIWQIDGAPHAYDVPTSGTTSTSRWFGEAIAAACGHTDYRAQRVAPGGASG